MIRFSNYKHVISKLTRGNKTIVCTVGIAHMCLRVLRAGTGLSLMLIHPGACFDKGHDDSILQIDVSVFPNIRARMITLAHTSRY